MTLFKGGVVRKGNEGTERARWKGFSGVGVNLTFLDGRLHVETDRPGKEGEGEGIYTWVVRCWRQLACSYLVSTSTRTNRSVTNPGWPVDVSYQLLPSFGVSMSKYIRHPE